MTGLYIMQMFDLAGIMLRPYKKQLIMAGAAVAIFAVGFGSGWQAKAHQDDKSALHKAETQVQTVIKEVRVRDEVERKIYVEDLARVRALEAEKQRLNTLVVSLRAQVNAYVPEVPSTPYVSTGAVGLLNGAASGIDPSSAGSSSSVAAGQDTAPSGVTWRALVDDGITVRKLYNDARNQCNALIDWTETHVVKANK